MSDDINIDEQEDGSAFVVLNAREINRRRG